MATYRQELEQDVGPIPNLGVHPVPDPGAARPGDVAASVPEASPSAVDTIPEGAEPVELPPAGLATDTEEVPAGAEPVEFATEEEVRKFSDDNTKRDLRYLFEKSIKENPDEKAQVLAIARYTGAKTSVIEKLLPEFKSRAEATQWDPDKFFTENRRIVNELLERPELLQVYMRDAPVSDLFKGLRMLALIGDYAAAGAGAAQSGLQVSPEKQKEIEPVKPTKEELLPKPQQVPTVDDPKSGLALYSAEWSRDRKMSLMNSLELKRRLMLRLGRETYDVDKQIVDIQNELSIVHNYGQGAVDQTLMDGLQVASSIYDTYKGGGAVGGTSAAVVGVGVAAVTRSKKLATAAARKAWKTGFAFGGYLSAWEQEFGNVALDLENDPEVAKNPELLDGASAVYATISGLVEVANELGPAAGAVLGPWRDAILKGEGKQFLKMAMKDATWKNIFLDAGKRWVKGVAGETSEEMIQQFLQDLDVWVAAKISGQDVVFPTAKVAQDVIQAGESAARGMAAVGAPTFGVTTFSLGLRKSAAERAAKRVQIVSEYAKSESPTLRAAPDFVAKQIEQETAESGERVTHLYVDPQAFTGIFEQQNVDPMEAAAEVMGTEGPARLKEAIATGSKLEVPLEEYLTKWGPKPVAELLKEDMTTRPEYKTPNEMKLVEEIEKVRSENEKLQKDYEKQQKQVEPFEQFLETFSEAVKATGKYKESAIEPMIEAWRKIIEVRASRDGLDKMQLAQTYIPQIAATAGVTPAEFAESLQTKMTPKTMEQAPVGQRPRFKSPAYKNRETGQVVPMSGGFHDIMELAKTIGMDYDNPEIDKFLDSFDGPESNFLWEPGFVNWEDQFESRPKGIRSTDFHFQEDPKNPNPAINYSQEYLKKFVDHSRQKVDFMKAFNVVMGTYAGNLVFAGKDVPLAFSISLKEYKGQKAWYADYFDWNHSGVGEFVFGNVEGAATTDINNVDSLEKKFGGKGHATRMYFSVLQKAQDAGVAWMSGMVRTEHTEEMYLRLQEKYKLPVKWDPTEKVYVIDAEDLQKVDLQAIFKKIAPEDVQIFEQAAYHGSPHRGIDFFKLIAIGSGQGAQSYGWGLYFAENRKVAETYRKELSWPILKINGKEQEMDASKKWEYSINREIATHMAGGDKSSFRRDPVSAEQAVENVKSRWKDFYAATNVDEEIQQYRKKAWDYLNSVDPKSLEVTDTGALYTVDVPATEELIDYDSAIPMQSEEIQKKLRRIDGRLKEKMNEISMDENMHHPMNLYFREFYSILGRVLRKNPDVTKELGLDAGASKEELASRYLGILGIPGLYYKDQISRGAPAGGTRNFVIWDESRVQNTSVQHQGGPTEMPRGFVLKMRNAVTKLYHLVLTEKADFSTFLHESGHIFIDILADAAEHPESSQQTKEDWAAMMKWLGVKDRSEITPESKLEEKFAKGFEKWLMTGELPSASLAEAFTRFKLWLKEIYKTTFGTYFSGIEIDPVIKGVFERMFATDREIERMQAMMGVKPFFRSPAEANMSAAEWQKYLRSQEIATSKAGQAAEKRALKGALRATEAWWRDELAKKLQDAYAEYDKQPAYRAWHFIRTGEMIQEDGTRIRPGLPKMDMAMVERILGRDGAKPYTGRLQKEGMNPDDLAQMFKFESGEQMLKAIAGLKSRDDVARARANEMMNEQHPDVLADRKNLAEMVEREFHNTMTLDTLLMEYRALRSKAVPGLGGVPIEAIKRAALEIVKKMAIGRLAPSVVLNAEKEAGERAFAAAAKDDYATAYVAKQQQILNFFIYKYLSDAKDNRDAFKKLIQKMNRQDKQEALGHAGKELLDNVLSVLEALGLRPPADPNEVSQRAGMDLLVQRLYAELTHPAFDEDRIRQLLVKPVPFKQMTVQDMDELTNFFKQVNKIATSTNKVWLDGRRHLVTNLVDKIREEAAAEPAVNEGQPISVTAMSRGYWMEQDASGILSAMVDPRILFQRLGPTAVKFFWRRYMERRNYEDYLIGRTMKFFEKNWNNLPEEMQKARYDLIDASGLPVPEDVNFDPSLPRDRQWLWMLFLNMGNKSNLERLAGGYKWTEEQLMAWIQGKLTEKEVEFLQSVWDLMDKELWPKIVEAYTQKNGAPPKKIESTKFLLRIKGSDKQISVRGGYFPAKYRADLSRRGLQQDMSSVEMMDRAMPGASVMKGFTQGRAKHYKDVVDLSWSVVPSHVGDVIHYLAFDQFVSDANRVLNTADTSTKDVEDKTIVKTGMRTILQRQLGEEYRHQIEQWLRVVANSRLDNTPRHMQKWMAALGWGRARFVMSTLGYSLGVALGDLPTVFTAWTTGKVKTKYFVPAFLQTIAHGPSSYARNLVVSKELDHRRQRLRSKMMEEMGRVGKQGKYNTRILEQVRDAAWFFMEHVDRMVSNAIFEAAYRQELARTDDANEAAFRADDIVQSLLPSHDAAEQPAFLRDKRSIGALIAFYGYFLKQFNVMKEIWHPVWKEWQEADGALEKGQAIALPATKAAGYTLATIFVTNVLGELMSGRGPEEDEEWAQWVARKMLVAPFMMVPFIGGAAETAIDRVISGKVRKLSIRGAPVLAGVQRIYDDIEKASRSKKRGSERVWAIIDATLTVANLPAAQVTRTGQYITDLATGYARPKDPIEATGRIIYGNRKDDPANIFTIHRRK